MLTPGCSPSRVISSKYSKARASCCALPHASMRMLYLRDGILIDGIRAVMRRCDTRRFDAPPHETMSAGTPEACICCITCTTCCHWRAFLYAVMSRLYMTTSTGSPT